MSSQTRISRWTKRRRIQLEFSRLLDETAPNSDDESDELRLRSESVPVVNTSPNASLVTGGDIVATTGETIVSVSVYYYY
jgi:hypothetical protein